MKSKSVKVADVVITSEKTGEILRGTVIDAGSRIQGKVNYIFNYKKSKNFKIWTAWDTNSIFSVVFEVDQNGFGENFLIFSTITSVTKVLINVKMSIQDITSVLKLHFQYMVEPENGLANDGPFWSMKSQFEQCAK